MLTVLEQPAAIGVAALSPADSGLPAYNDRLTLVETGLGGESPFVLPGTIGPQHYGKALLVDQATSDYVTLPKDAPAGKTVVFLVESDGLPVFICWDNNPPRNRSGNVAAAGRYAVVAVLCARNVDGQSAEWWLAGDTSDSPL